jgi:hypothetical protein
MIIYDNLDKCLLLKDGRPPCLFKSVTKLGRVNKATNQTLTIHSLVCLDIHFCFKLLCSLKKTMTNHKILLNFIIIRNMSNKTLCNI